MLEMIFIIIYNKTIQCVGEANLAMQNGQYVM